MTNFVELNLARNCIKYIIKAYGIKEIFIPFYTCQTVWNAISETHCKIKFYHIDKNFMPKITFPKDAYILYTNYFGLCYQNCKTLSLNYPNLIIDNSHAFYANHLGIASFKSLRKFFNISNGAYLYSDKLLNEDFAQDNYINNPVLIHQNYNQFVKNELELNNQKQIKYLNPIIKNQIKQINYEKDKQLRLKIFKQYAKIFDEYNNIIFKPNEENIPYCYPLSLKDINFAKPIIKNHLILLHLWKPLPKEFEEYKFLNNTIALPLNDEKYSEEIIKIYTKEKAGKSCTTPR